MTPEWSPEAEVDGSKVLDDIEYALRLYCVLPSEAAYVGVVLWIAYTHAALSFDFAPRLVVRSAMKRSGKSRLLEVVGELVKNPLPTVNASTPYIFRSLSEDSVTTLIFDEADTIFGTKTKADQNEDLRGLLNAGFRKGGKVGRVVGPNHDPQEFQTFAPAALAGIGQMPDTIEDRAVVVVMKRRAAGENVLPFRMRTNGAVLLETHDAIEGWLNKKRLDELSKTIPKNLGVEDRAADVWEPLVAIADLAGGDWPSRAREAARILCSQHDDDDDDSEAMQLIADIEVVLRNYTSNLITPAKLLEHLLFIEGFTNSPWQGMTPRSLSNRLKDHQIVTKSRRTPSKSSERTYTWEQLHDLVVRHLPADPDPKGASASSASSADAA